MGPEGGRPVTPAIALASLLVLLIGAAILIAAPRIQSDIETRANAALQSSGYGGFVADANGCAVTLSGASPDRVSAEAALAVVAALPGVCSVRIEIGESQSAAVPGGTAPPIGAGAYRFGARWDGRTLTLTGFLPTRDAREATVTHARDVLKGVEVDDETEAAPGAPDGNWQSIVAAGIAAMQTLADARMEIAGTAVTFTGVARDAAGHAQANDILDSFPAPYMVSADLRVDANAPAAPPPPYRFSAAHDGAGTALAGSVPSPEMAQFFADTLKGAMPDAAIDDRSRPAGGAPDGAWGDAVALALTALAPTQGATLTVEGRTLTIEALALNDSGRETMLGSFADLPAGYKLTVRVSSEGRAAIEEKTFGAGDDPAARCQAAFDTALASAPPVFADNAAKLSPESGAAIDRLVAIAATCPDGRLEIAGHTEAGGKAAANVKLSEARAKAVAAALTAKGVDAGRLVTRGYGGARPVASNEDDAGRAKNRRIEVIVRR